MQENASFIPVALKFKLKKFFLFVSPITCAHAAQVVKTMIDA